MEKLVQITSGRGPAECCWVVAQVLKMLLEEFRIKGVNCEVLAAEKGPENGTLYSALVSLTSSDQSIDLNAWTGTIQWIGQSKYRKFHKRKNWFVGIKELARDPSWEIREQDIEYQAIRSGGPGGQHVNKVNSAVRARHRPTGVMVVASDRRSQQQNKKLARQRLEVQLQLEYQKDKLQKVQGDWQNHNALERGNPVKVFTGMNFKEKRKRTPGGKGNSGRVDSHQDRRKHRNLQKWEDN